MAVSILFVLQEENVTPFPPQSKTISRKLRKHKQFPHENRVWNSLGGKMGEMAPRPFDRFMLTT